MGNIEAAKRTEEPHAGGSSASIWKGIQRRDKGEWRNNEVLVENFTQWMELGMVLMSIKATYI